jgi:hypothetical protein
MTHTSILLTNEERQYLLNMVQNALGESRVEAHRTHTPEFRERVLAEQNLLRQLVTKLEKS